MKYTDSLKDNRAFRRLYSSKKSFVSPFFVIYAKKNSLGVNRLGFTVGTKIGGAVQRNKVKRRLREMYRLNECFVKNSFDIVIVARTRSANADFKTLCSTFINAINNIEMAK